MVVAWMVGREFIDGMVVCVFAEIEEAAVTMGVTAVYLNIYKMIILLNDIL